MKQRLLPTLGLAGFVIAAWAAPAIVCERNGAKASSASMRTAAHAKCASKTSNASFAANGSCTSKNATFTNAATHEACSNKATSVAANVSGGSCAAKSSKSNANAAVMASAGGKDCCAAKKTQASAAMASDHCAGKTSGAAASQVVDAVPVGGGATCSGHGMGKMAGGEKHGDCDACADMAMCEQELKDIGSQAQVVPLKNGIMFVYTADGAGKVRAIQQAMARRSDRLTALASAKGSNLCPDCRTIRGAVASGKLRREVVNIEGGCLTLMTSSDPGMITRIYAMAGLPATVRAKT